MKGNVPLTVTFSLIILATGSVSEAAKFLRILR